MNKRTAQALIWILSIALTARLTWAAHQHHMPILDTLAIASVALYAFRAGFQVLAIRHQARDAGASR